MLKFQKPIKEEGNNNKNKQISNTKTLANNFLSNVLLNYRKN